MAASSERWSAQEQGAMMSGDRLGECEGGEYESSGGDLSQSAGRGHRELAAGAKHEVEVDRPLVTSTECRAIDPDGPFGLTHRLSQIRACGGKIRRLFERAEWGRKHATDCLHVRCDRNSGFEIVSHVLDAFMSSWRARHTVSFSGYDHALPEVGRNDSCDLHVIWLDWRPYARKMTPDEACRWLTGVLSREAGHLFLVNNWVPNAPGDGSEQWTQELNHGLVEVVSGAAGGVILDLAAMFYDQEPEQVFDSRNEQLAATPLSKESLIRVASTIGTGILPTARHGRLRAIIVDLDETLYGGNLGDDGASGVHLSSHHQTLQELLVKLRRSGVLLAVASKNNMADVKELFAKRKDFPLRWSDFAMVEASWERKSISVTKILEQMRFSAADTLFLDDNVAEIAEVAENCGVHPLRASNDPQVTTEMLASTPRLHNIGIDHAAEHRNRDYLGNRLRSKYKDQFRDESAYLVSIDTQVDIFLTQKDHFPRVLELSRKTNQFNLNYLRLRPMDLHRMVAGGVAVLSFSVRDKFSDSGIVGAILAHRKASVVEVLEFLVSCRVLGRGIETLAAAALMTRAYPESPESVLFRAKVKERNAPAREWLSRLDPAVRPGVPISLERLRLALDRRAEKFPATVRYWGF